MKKALPIFVALAALYGLIALFRTAQKFDPSRLATRSQDLKEGLGEVSVRIEEATLEGRTLGIPDFRLSSDRIDIQRNRDGDLQDYDSVLLDRVYEGALFKDGKKQATFSADSAVYRRASRQFEINGHIRVKSDKDERLESELLVWSEAEDFLRFPLGATARSARNSAKAPVMVYTPRKRSLQCLQGAELMVNGYPILTSNLVWDIGKETVNCPTRVTGRRKSLDFSADSARFNLKTGDMKAQNVSFQLKVDSANDLEESIR